MRHDSHAFTVYRAEARTVEQLLSSPHHDRAFLVHARRSAVFYAGIRHEPEYGEIARDRLTEFATLPQAVAFRRSALRSSAHVPVIADLAAVALSGSPLGTVSGLDEARPSVQVAQQVVLALQTDDLMPLHGVCEWLGAARSAALVPRREQAALLHLVADAWELVDGQLGAGRFLVRQARPLPAAELLRRPVSRPAAGQYEPRSSR